MQRNTGKLAAIVSFGGILMASTAIAQTPADTLPESLLDCADEPDALARLACYDREIAQLGRTPPAVAETAPVQEAATRAPEKAPVPPASQNKERHEPEPGEFSARVVDIRRRPRGEMVILLDNEQIWEQKHSGSRFRLNVGDTATVKESTFGGYRLFGKGNRSIQVERIQ